MPNNTYFTRRRLLKTAGGLALVSSVSAPAILRAQTSDVTVSSKTIRRTALTHSIISFLFNAALLALTVNIAASAI